MKIGWLICLLLVVLNFCLLFSPTTTLIHMTREDGIVENASALFLLLSAIIFGICYVQSKRGKIEGSWIKGNIFFLLLGLFFFIAMAEEISWGQRIFNVETPEILKDLNYQEEINLHNFRIFEGKNPDGSQKGGLAAVFTSHRIFYMIILGWTLFLPLAFKYAPTIREFLIRINFPIHPARIGLLVLSVLIVARLIKSISQQPSEDFSHAVTEISELNLALVIAYTAFYWLRQPKSGQVASRLVTE